MTAVTNNRDFTQVFQRVVTQPDFLFTAQDMVPGPATPPRYYSISARNINLATNLAFGGLNGPGVINPITTMTFNKSGPIFYNQSTNQIWTLDDLTKFRRVMWGSFDDSTNAPVVYPNDVSITMLENAILLQVVNTTLPNGKVGVTYSAQLQGAGGHAPYTWSLVPNSPALPPGLYLSGDGSGLISGKPTTAGVYDFAIRLTDVNGRFADWQVTLTVNR